MNDLASLFQKVIDLLKYDPNSPLIFSSGLFLFLFCIFAFVYQRYRNSFVPRILYVTLFSLYFYYKTSGMFFLLLVLLSFTDFTLGHLIWTAKTRARAKLFVAISVVCNLSLLGYFKYTNFFIGFLNDVNGENWLDFQNIFLPIGISFFTFQSMSYVIDLYRGDTQPVRRWIDYLFYLSFFPQLVAGPIVRARDFIPQIYKYPVVTREMFGTGVFLILSGLFKKAIISDYISLNFVDRVFEQPLLYSGFENLMGVYGYALQIYCDFSGYSDMAIGLALLLGFHFPQNFNSPYQSATITEFWRRWHISLSSWLRDYLYISLGGNRKGRVRTYGNLILTMLLGGLWHGAAWRFLLWGAIHGVALAIHKLMMTLMPRFFQPTGETMSWWSRGFAIFFTFNLVCFSWIFFRADNMQIASQVLSQIFTNFDAKLIPDVITGYLGVFNLMVLGYVLHFMPGKVELGFQQMVIKTPLTVKAVVLAILIWGVMQIKSSDIQPFIYFQF